MFNIQCSISIAIASSAAELLYPTSIRCCRSFEGPSGPRAGGMPWSVWADHNFVDDYCCPPLSPCLRGVQGHALQVAPSFLCSDIRWLTGRPLEQAAERNDHGFSFAGSIMTSRMGTVNLAGLICLIVSWHISIRTATEQRDQGEYTDTDSRQPQTASEPHSERAAPPLRRLSAHARTPRGAHRPARPSTTGRGRRAQSTAVRSSRRRTEV